MGRTATWAVLKVTILELSTGPQLHMEDGWQQQLSAAVTVMVTLRNAARPGFTFTSHFPSECLQDVVLNTSIVR